jgi:sn-glycerol 3-phosphate transport system permease protein
MIENRPLATLMAHLMLILGIVIVAFPIYYTFIASTATSVDIIRPPLSLLPGGHMIENYHDAIAGGVAAALNDYLDLLAGVLILWYGGSIAMHPAGAISVGQLITYQL